MFAPAWSQSWILVVAGTAFDQFGNPDSYSWKSFRGRIVYGDKLTATMSTGVWTLSKAECYIPYQAIKPWIEAGEADPDNESFTLDLFYEMDTFLVAGEGSTLPFNKNLMNDVVLYQEKRSLTNLKLGYIYLGDR
jgi:hypothetical protein